MYYNQLSFMTLCITIKSYLFTYALMIQKHYTSEELSSIKNSIIAAAVGIASITLIVSLVYINYNNSNPVAQAQTPTSGHSINTFHAKGMIGTLVSHMLSPSVTSSLGIANSTNLLKSTYLPEVVSKSNRGSVSAAATTTTMSSVNGTVIKGPISRSLFAKSLTNPTIVLPKIYIAAGDWKLDAMNGKVQNFIANFTEVLDTGNNPHIHTIANFRESSNNSVSLSPDNSISFFGTADILKNGKVSWSDVPIKVFVAKGYAISVSIDAAKSADHFRGIPIFGIVTSLTSQNNKEVRTPIFASSGNTTAGS
jgi:hypothetical protein